MLQGRKAYNNICYLHSHTIQGHKIETRKNFVERVRFCDVVEVYEDLGRRWNLLG